MRHAGRPEPPHRTCLHHGAMNHGYERVLTVAGAKTRLSGKSAQPELPGLHCRHVCVIDWVLDLIAYVQPPPCSQLMRPAAPLLHADPAAGNDRV